FVVWFFWRNKWEPSKKEVYGSEEYGQKNSPLYQYLQDLGHTDFEICSSLSPKPEKSTVTEGQQKPPARALPKVSSKPNESEPLVWGPKNMFLTKISR
uniref:Uncharacterized protein n=1 Tax=Felis catus TaxID=9685 RepID=A0ABI7ZVZ1_FELCA